MEKDLKSSFKEIKKLIKEKESILAMKKCQKLLKDDKNNYTALVLMGVAMKDIEEYSSQAPLAFKKAIQLQETNLLAWQGLVNYYEKQPNNNEKWLELLTAYSTLIQIDHDENKFSYYLDQITGSLINFNNIHFIDKLIDILNHLKDNKNQEEVYKLDETLIFIFNKYPQAEKNHSELYENILFSIVQNSNLHDCKKYLDYSRKYLKFLFLDKKFSKILSTAIKIHENYPQELFPLEWICRTYAEGNVTNDLSFEENIKIDNYYKSLINLDNNSALGIFAKSIHFWKSNNLIEARDLLHQVIVLNSQMMYAWAALSLLNLKLQCYIECENSALQALQLLYNESHYLYKTINLLLLESIIKNDDCSKWDQAFSKCQQLLGKDSSNNKLKLLLARLEAMKKNPQVVAMLNELKEESDIKIEALIIHAIYLINNDSLSEALDILESDIKTSEIWQIIGEIYWKMLNYNKSLIAFLKSLQLNSYNWKSLIYLGHYYRGQGNDLERSRKCYQKALRINPHSEDAGAGLSTTYRLLKNTEANMEMLQRVTKEDGGGPKWAWLQLGLQQLDRNDISQAIKSLRYVIRADPNDNHCWESLADAYWARGAHLSALKSYQRALELSPGSLYPLIQLANIKLVLRRHEEAKEAFTEILIKKKNYIPALKGFAETCLGLARENSRAQLLGRVQRNAQEAMDSLTIAIIENDNLSCLWKLVGDTCCTVAILPNKYCFLKVNTGLVKSETWKNCEEITEICKNELFILTARCYCRALNISQDSALLWHDLACSYLYQLYHDNTINKSIVAQKSFEAAKQAVKLNSSTWVHWNILGVICMNNEIKNYALAQHCWVMAIDCEPTNATCWTNLGTLYLHLGDAYKANEAFSRAQRADPDFQNSWIGQALIAESMQNSEAMILYRHAIQLGYHPQAAVGYAHYVLKMILDLETKKDPLYSYVIVNMHAIPVAVDAMMWYTEREPDNMYGRNSLGLLLERQKLLKTCANEFKEALKLSNGDKSKENKVRINFARVLVELGEYDEALEVCEKIDSASFNSQCQLALTLFKSKKFEESYAAYAAALNWLADAGSDKAHLLCAMASMAYLFQDIDDVKTLIFQCIQIQPPTVAGLLAAAALGLLHQDYNLTTLVLKELEPWKNDSNYRHHIALLTSFLYLMNDNPIQAVFIISKAIYNYPNDVGLWICLVRILIETNSNNFGICAQKALYFGRKNSTDAITQIACISSLGQLINDYITRQKYSIDGLRSVQKTVHSFPGVIESWANLIAALLLRREMETDSFKNNWLSSLITTVKNNFDSSNSMDEWLKSYQNNN